MRGNIIKPQIQAQLLQRKVIHDDDEDEDDNLNLFLLERIYIVYFVNKPVTPIKRFMRTKTKNV